MYQPPLPAPWASDVVSYRDARSELELIARDKAETRAGIYALLEAFARKHRISLREVNRVMHGYADDMLADLAYERVSDLERELEEAERD